MELTYHLVVFMLTLLHYSLIKIMQHLFFYTCIKYKEDSVGGGPNALSAALLLCSSAYLVIASTDFMMHQYLRSDISVPLDMFLCLLQ